MSQPQTVDLLAGLKVQSTFGKPGITGKKVSVQIDVKQEAHVNVDPTYWAGAMAAELKDTITRNMLSGLTPSGRPLPVVSASTQKRRAYRADQVARGGYPKVGGRVKKWKDVDKAKRNIARRYQAKGSQLMAQGPFIPLPGNSAGVESGMLAKSVAVVQEGQGFRVYFADARAVQDGHGTSPVHRVAMTGALDMTGIANQPTVQAAMQQTADKAIAKDNKQLLQQIAKLMRSLEQGIGQAKSP